MNILYVTTGRVSDINNWSGLVNHIFKVLSKNNEVDILEVDRKIVVKIVKRFGRKLFSMMQKYTSVAFRLDREPFLLKYYAIQIKNCIKKQKYDLIFSPYPWMFAYVETNIPKVMWHDALFHILTDYYPTLTRLCSRTIRMGNMHDQMSMERSDHIILASEWAKNDALNYYHIESKKISCIVFGSNLNINNSYEDINMIISTKSKTNINLLFVGVDWKRKGGDTAVEVTEYIHSLGINVKLYIIGCNPFISNEQKEYIEVIGFLNKNDNEGTKKLIKFYTQAHFLLLPTKQECLGVVFCEASSFALPSLTRKTGGVEAVVDDNNGHVFDFDASARSYGDYIINLFNDWDKYKLLCFSSYKKYCENLNWNVVGDQVQKKLIEICNKSYL